MLEPTKIPDYRFKSVSERALDSANVSIFDPRGEWDFWWEVSLEGSLRLGDEAAAVCDVTIYHMVWSTPAFLASTF